MKTKKEIENEISRIENEAREEGYLKGKAWYFNDDKGRVNFSMAQCLKWVLSDTKKEKK